MVQTIVWQFNFVSSCMNMVLIEKKEKYLYIIYVFLNFFKVVTKENKI